MHFPHEHYLSPKDSLLVPKFSYALCCNVRSILSSNKNTWTLGGCSKLIATLPVGLRQFFYWCSFGTKIKGGSNMLQISDCSISFILFCYLHILLANLRKSSLYQKFKGHQVELQDPCRWDFHPADMKTMNDEWCSIFWFIHLSLTKNNQKKLFTLFLLRNPKFYTR